jgi:hypothetical protein
MVGEDGAVSCLGQPLPATEPLHREPCDQSPERRRARAVEPGLRGPLAFSHLRADITASPDASKGPTRTPVDGFTPDVDDGDCPGSRTLGNGDLDLTWGAGYARSAIRAQSRRLPGDRDRHAVSAMPVRPTPRGPSSARNAPPRSRGRAPAAPPRSQPPPSSVPSAPTRWRERLLPRRGSSRPRATLRSTSLRRSSRPGAPWRASESRSPSSSPT